MEGFAVVCKQQVKHSLKCDWQIRSRQVYAILIQGKPSLVMYEHYENMSHPQCVR